MRRLNAITSILLVVLFVAHLVWGGMELLGMVGGGSVVYTALTHLLLTLLCVHTFIGICYTVKTFLAAKQSHYFYWKENRLFLLRRISGFAILIFLVVHVLIFRGTTKDGRFFLNPFDLPALISQLLLVVSLLFHLMTNIRPLRISLGLSDKGGWRWDAALVVSILLFLSGVAFLVYYLRWQAL